MRRSQRDDSIAVPERAPRWRRGMTIRSRLVVLIVLGATGVLLMSVISGFQLRQTITDERDGRTKAMVEAGLSVVTAYADEAKAGRMTEEQAKKQVLLALDKVRYAGNEYMWTHTLDLKMVQHAVRKDLVGTDISQVKSVDGVAIFAGMNQVVRDNDGKGFYRSATRR